MRIVKRDSNVDDLDGLTFTGYGITSNTDRYGSRRNYDETTNQNDAYTHVDIFWVGCQADPALLARLDAVAENAGGVNLSPSDVTFNLSVIEFKDATDGIPAPEVSPLELSSGRRFSAPGEYDSDNPDKWQVSTYMFTPASLTVAQGDSVALKTFVVKWGSPYSLAGSSGWLHS